MHTLRLPLPVDLYYDSRSIQASSLPCWRFNLHEYTVLGVPDYIQGTQGLQASGPGHFWSSQDASIKGLATRELEHKIPQVIRSPQTHLFPQPHTFPFTMTALSLATTSLEDALLPRMDASEVADRIKAMRKQEQTTYFCTDYLKDNAKQLRKARKPVDEECRVKMCEWCYQVVDFCKFRRETVSISMSYLDRFLGTRKGRYALLDRKDYQLVAMTTLYMAIKLHEPLEMETSLLADLSRGAYNEVEIMNMEQSVLDALNWRIQGPTVLAFVQHFLALLPDSVPPAVATAIMDYARFQTELVTPNYSLVACQQSHVALAAILNAIEGMDQSMLSLREQGAFLRTVEKFSGLLREDVEDVQEVLNSILLDVYAEDMPQESDTQSSIRKYSSRSGGGEVAEEESYRRRARQSVSKSRSPVCVARK